MSKTKPGNRIFTLVELLIVIAVIAILTSLLLPALGKAKDAAKGIVCLGNLKTIGLAQSGYSDDFDGWIVPQTQDGYGSNGGWFNMLSGSNTEPPSQGYGAKHRRGEWNSSSPTGTFACPSEQVGWGSFTDSPPKFGYTHYGVNHYVCGYISGGVVYGASRKVADVKLASVAVFAADTNHRGSFHVGNVTLAAYRHGAHDPRPVTVYQDAYAVLPLSAFKGRTNVLYFDGHAAARGVVELRNQPDESGISSYTSFAQAGIRQ